MLKLNVLYRKVRCKIKDLVTRTLFNTMVPVNVDVMENVVVAEVVESGILVVMGLTMAVLVVVNHMDQLTVVVVTDHMVVVVVGLLEAVVIIPTVEVGVVGGTVVEQTVEMVGITTNHTNSTSMGVGILVVV
jgi:hypothetical protein